MTSPSKIYHADCLEKMAELEENSIHAIVCDPPYELTSITKRFGKKEAAPAKHGTDGRFSRLSKGFMGCTWDGTGIAMRPAVWEQALRVAKPGAYLLAFGGSRTFHRLACAIEDAEWVLRDTMMWVTGQGFPKSHDVSTAIDRKAGAKRKVVGVKRGVGGENLNDIVRGVPVRQTTDEGGKGVGAYGAGAKQIPVDVPITEPATPEAKQWDGFGTALKPAWESVLLFQKPLEGATSEEIRRITGWRRWYTYNGRWSWHGTSDEEWRKSGVYKACEEYGLVWWEEEKEDGSIERFIYRRRWDALVSWGQGRYSLIGKNKRKVIKRWPYKNKRYVDNVANSLKWGCGALNISACRIGADNVQINKLKKWSGFGQEKRPNYTPEQSQGRWPANFLLSHSSECVKRKAYIGHLGNQPRLLFERDGIPPDDSLEKLNVWRCAHDCPVQMLDEQSGVLKSGFMKAGQMRKRSEGRGGYHGGFVGGATENGTYGDQGGASRFFYCSKASRRERNAGLEGFEEKVKVFNGQAEQSSSDLNGTLPKNQECPFILPLYHILSIDKKKTPSRSLCRHSVALRAG